MDHYPYLKIPTVLVTACFPEQPSDNKDCFEPNRQPVPMSATLFLGLHLIVIVETVQNLQFYENLQQQKIKCIIICNEREMQIFGKGKATCQCMQVSPVFQQDQPLYYHLFKEKILYYFSLNTCIYSYTHWNEEKTPSNYFKELFGNTFLIIICFADSQLISLAQAHFSLKVRDWETYKNQLSTYSIIHVLTPFY